MYIFIFLQLVEPQASRHFHHPEMVYLENRLKPYHGMFVAYQNSTKFLVHKENVIYICEIIDQK